MWTIRVHIGEPTSIFSEWRIAPWLFEIEGDLV